MELRAKSFTVKIDISYEISNRFRKPIVFYLSHKKDLRAFFITFVILDFFRKEIKYIVSYLPENIKKVENHPDEKFFRLMLSAYNPHSTLEIKSGEDFLTFVENGYYFYRVNYKENVINIFTSRDILKREQKKLVEFGSTFYKDDCDKNCFYLTTFSRRNSNGKHELNVYKANLDLSSFLTVFSTESSSISAPHTTRKHGNFLLNSEFMFRKFINKMTGQIFESPVEYMKFVYKDLFREYCRKKNKKFLLDEFGFQNKVRLGNVKLEPEFSSFCKSKGKNFFDICSNDNKYFFEPLPGMFTLINLLKGEINTYPTSFCSPAHFEVDEETAEVYVSSHNFAILDRLYYFGPAALDKFELKEGKMQKKATFSNRAGYRFTSHRVFSCDGKKYICTIGHPNRLFFVRAEDMKLEYYDDIGHDFLSDKIGVTQFINDNYLDYHTIKTIEMSSDGNFVFLLSHEYIYIYDFKQRKIICKLKYIFDFPIAPGLNLNHFYKRTTHSNYLE